MREVMMMNGVDTCIVDMCTYGLKSYDERAEGAAKKVTRLMSNCNALIVGMSRRCSGDHWHVQLLGGRAGPAAIYTSSFCNQMVKIY